MTTNERIVVPISHLGKLERSCDLHKDTGPQSRELVGVGVCPAAQPRSTLLSQTHALRAACGHGYVLFNSHSVFKKNQLAHSTF